MKTADLLAGDMPPRDRQSLSQSLDALTRAYANITKNDVTLSEQEQMRKTMSMLDLLMVQVRARGDDPDLRVEVQADGTKVTHFASGGSIEE